MALWVALPTATTQGAMAGELMVLSLGPMLPADEAMKMPAERALRKARSAVPAPQGSRASPPIE